MSQAIMITLEMQQAGYTYYAQLTLRGSYMFLLFFDLQISKVTNRLKQLTDHQHEPTSVKQMFSCNAGSSIPTPAANVS